jgi:hypothetical protein
MFITNDGWNHDIDFKSWWLRTIIEKVELEGGYLRSAWAKVGETLSQQ